MGMVCLFLWRRILKKKMYNIFQRFLQQYQDVREEISIPSLQNLLTFRWSAVMDASLVAYFLHCTPSLMIKFRVMMAIQRSSSLMHGLLLEVSLSPRPNIFSSLVPCLHGSMLPSCLLTMKKFKPIA